MTKTPAEKLATFHMSALEVEQAAVTYLMENELGRAWVYSLLANWGAFASPFSAAGNAQTNFNCGVHQAALTLLSQITAHTPELYVRMLEERKEENERRSAELAARSDNPFY